jgi:sulfotransferase family protein
MHDKYPFDRPVVILAAPRSGSTLLFETLTGSSDFWTIGGESHAAFENINRFNPVMGFCDSNALFAADATPQIVGQIRNWFYQQLRDVTGRTIQDLRGTMDKAPRLLEKTPKNALRVSLLNEIFPDALFIYLYRNPRENISSMMDAWASGRFVTYPSLPGRNGPWSLLLPPDWQSYHNATLEQITAFQWQAANRGILVELANLNRDRWLAVSYGQQVHSAAATVQKICDFCGVSAAGILDALATGQSKLSRYTLAPPSADKWHSNAAALSRVLPGLKDTVEFIRTSTSGLPEDEFDLSVDAILRG